LKTLFTGRKGGGEEKAIQKKQLLSSLPPLLPVKYS
jgi:hypothetical protein